jgi:hypothetical protein
MEVKSRCSILGCARTGLLSSGSHRDGWVDVAGARDRPLFMSKGTSHGSGYEQANVLSPPLNNSGTGFEPLLSLSWWHKQ